MKDAPLDQPVCSYEDCARRVFTSCDQCGKPYCSDHIRLNAPRRYVCYTCLGEPAPVTNPSSQPAPVRSSSGGCLKDGGVTLGIISIVATALLVPLAIAVNHSYDRDCVEVYLFPILLLWLIIALPTALSSGIGALVYSRRAPNTRGPARRPLIIGGVALGLLLLGWIIFMMTSPQNYYCVI